MALSHEDVRKILAILDESDCEEVDLEFGDLKLHLRRRGGGSELGVVRDSGERASQPPPEMPDRRSAPVQPEPGKENREEALPQGIVAVTAPMLGTFYRAPSPGEKPFVEVGDRVAVDDTVCLLEVMKLCNSVKAGVAGIVEKILVEDAALVEDGQRLMLIRCDPA